MVELNSEKLFESYQNFIAIRGALVYIEKEALRRNNEDFLKQIHFPYLGEKPKDKKNFVATKMDIMVQSIDELIILGLVSDFEKIVFDRVENASGEITKIVKKNYNSLPFKKFSTDFVKNVKDIDKLSIIKAIIASKLPEDLSKQFTQVIDFRNRLAHGKRFGEQSLMAFDEIARTLDDVLSNI